MWVIIKISNKAVHIGEITSDEGLLLLKMLLQMNFLLVLINIVKRCRGQNVFAFRHSTFLLYRGNIQAAKRGQNLIVGFAANGAFALFKFNNQGRAHTAHERQTAAGQALV